MTLVGNHDVVGCHGQKYDPECDQFFVGFFERLSGQRDGQQEVDGEDDGGGADGHAEEQELAKSFLEMNSLSQTEQLNTRLNSKVMQHQPL